MQLTVASLAVRRRDARGRRTPGRIADIAKLIEDAQAKLTERGLNKGQIA